MVAYDSRRALDPAQILGHEIIALLRAALRDQRSAGREPIVALQSAVTVAAKEARARDLPPEALLIQLKALADEVGIRPVDHTMADEPRATGVREWMVRALLTAYWQPVSEG
jgi:hypothetical protein